MKKITLSEIIILTATSFITIVIAIGAISYFAPQLLGISSDIRMVKTSKKIPPFFENVFRVSDYDTDEYIISDPIIKRAKPLFPNLGGFGPNDLLGFRNRSIPNVADVIIIGDSQTYGNNASIETNWPNLFLQNLRKQGSFINKYDMAVGGWGAIEYLEIFYKSLYFKPRTIVVAFYSGNDPLETFRTAYSNNRWFKYQTNKSLSASDLPSVEFPPPNSEQWEVNFSDGVSTIFTPKNRLYSNEKNNVAKAGYEGILMVAKEIAKVCLERDISLVFTIIPTKELAYQRKVAKEISDPDQIYSKLVIQEKEYITWFQNQLKSIQNVQFVDMVEPLQAKAMDSNQLYPRDANGHPFASGYKVIADALAENFEINWSIPNGLVALFNDENKYQLGLVRDGNYWSFANEDVIEANGWDVNTVPMSIKPRDIANYPMRGVISIVNKELFGPNY